MLYTMVGAHLVYVLDLLCWKVQLSTAVHKKGPRAIYDNRCMSCIRLKKVELFTAKGRKGSPVLYIYNGTCSL